MSQRPINLSDDLKRLREDGYNIKIRGNFLVLNDIPYVNEEKQIQRGVLATSLALADDVTQNPVDDHVVWFCGTHPCQHDGVKLVKLVNESREFPIDGDLIANHSFSHKPILGDRKYKDYYEKMTTYVAILLQQAKTLDPNITAQTYPIIEDEEDTSVFNYIDTASSRAGIGDINQKLAIEKIAIIGIGGTGSYILDLVAKTPVKQIHLFDGDKLLQHNVFRAPGAHLGKDISGAPNKAQFFADVYSKMRKNVFAINSFIDESNIDLLKDMGFVFICIDQGKAKKLIIEKLSEIGISFVDVGMGIHVTDNCLNGILRVTAGTSTKKDHITNRIPLSEGEENEYSSNIQVADLNALNATLAVIRWKKMFGFYLDKEYEHFSGYAIDGNHIVNGDQL